MQDYCRVTPARARHLLHEVAATQAKVAEAVASLGRRGREVTLAQHALYSQEDLLEDRGREALSKHRSWVAETIIAEKRAKYIDTVVRIEKAAAAVAYDDETRVKKEE